jgi:hypothetical protein
VTRLPWPPRKNKTYGRYDSIFFDVAENVSFQRFWPMSMRVSRFSKNTAFWRVGQKLCSLHAKRGVFLHRQAEPAPYIERRREATDGHGFSAKGALQSSLGNAQGKTCNAKFKG